MFAGINSRSRPGVGMIRPHKSRVPAKSKTKPNDDETEAKKPDTAELRSLRTAYYGAASSSKRTGSRPKSTVKTEDQTASKSRKRAEEVKHRGRKHKSTGSRIEGHRETRGKSYSRRRTEEYVYGLSAIRGDDRRPSSGSDPSLVRQRRSSDSSSSSRTGLSTVTEDDIVPGDSVSQNGRRRREQAASASRPPLARRSTTPARLPTSSEADVKSTKNSTVAPRKANRSSTSIFGALLRRSTTSSIPSPAPQVVECLTCGSDDVPVTRSAKLECGHRMCSDCLKRVFQMSVKDPAHMPPKCCTDRHIPLKHVEKLFDLKFKMLWNRKYQEYHAKDRIYCPVAKCGEWIKPAHFRSLQGRKYATCPRCKTKVCVLCNSKMHKSQECPKDPEIARLVEQAKEEGWQTCFNCRAIVERKEGCNHMTCRCQAEFCIMCGLKWKTCECPWFDYNGIADHFQANDFRVPEGIRVYLRHGPGAIIPEAAEAGPERIRPPPPPAAAVAAATAAVAAVTPAPRPEQPRNRTYAAELAQRRRQERSDAALARRMQLASLMDSDDDDSPSPARPAENETWGVGNAAGHFMNDDFVQNAADVVMQAFGDAEFGRRGERAAGRRRAPGQTQQNRTNDGLAPNFLGDESILGAGPSRRPEGQRSEPSESDESEDSDGS